ncbi:MAG: DNA mismatch repair protein MutS [Candidatus Euphemobacter frigidus]|nr:DNA mismatch repair protein MutS [Candidatus Euphemobacter frigidus]
MMKQYRELKASVKDAILLFRLGDFYEMFNEDAKIAAPIMEIALTARHTTPMCGIPHHAADGYIAKLLKAGKKVAICEQVEDPRQAKGIVKRDVIRIITPGTAVEEELLKSGKNNYLAAVHRLGQIYGFAYLELSTGEFKVTELTSRDELQNELERIRPSECLLPVSLAAHLEEFESRISGIILTPLEDWFFDFDMAYEALKKQFKTATLDGFGCQQLVSGVGAAGAIIGYVSENLKTSLAHVHSLSVFSSKEFMVMDAVSQSNLEIIEPLRGGDRKATLLGVLDRTVTSMGSRTLRAWLLQPLLAPESIKNRLDGVEELTRERALLVSIRELLKEIRDIGRIIGRVSCGRTNARELVILRDSLKVIPRLKKVLEKLRTETAREKAENLEVPPALVSLLQEALVDNPPLTIKEGGMFRSGYNSELDELHTLTRDGKNWISRFQETEIRRTGIKSLKVRYNKVFGYYIEVTRPNLSLVPDNYIPKQTLVNAERFITEELKSYENKVLGAQDTAAALEYKLFEDIREAVREESPSIQRCAVAVGAIDALAALAEVALSNRYVKPEIESSDRLEIINGRHPVVERILVDERFVGNDTIMDGNENQIFIITGPNMAGKSTYIRQVALIVLMAQIGSFVPADSARIGIVDRIFTRVGAADELARGQSTFMVEMIETANILHHATPRSLVVLDEIGRGTSTFDGISIAWSVAEYLHNHAPSKARTLFATHYHELTELELTLPGAKNYNVAVREWNNEVVFLRKVIRGGTDKSYGIQVARLAGLPRTVIERAGIILTNLEEEALSAEGVPRLVGDTGSRETGAARQLYLFETESHPVLSELRNINLDHLTPFEAMQRLKAMKERVLED